MANGSLDFYPMKNQQRLLLFFLFLNLYSSSIAQSGSLRAQLQGGQSGDFYGTTILSPDDHYAVTQTGNVIDVKKGVVLHKGLQLDKVFMLKDNQRLLSLSRGKIQVIDYLSNTVERELTSPDIDNYFNIPLTSNGEWMVFIQEKNTGGTPLEDKTDAVNNAILAQKTTAPGIHLIRMPEGKWDKTIPLGKGVPIRWALEADCLALVKTAVGDNILSFSFYALSTGSIQYQTNLPNPGNSTAYLSPDGRTFFYLNLYDEVVNTIMNTQTGKALQAFKAINLREIVAQRGVTFSTDGHKVALVQKGPSPESPATISIVNLMEDRVTYSGTSEAGFTKITFSLDLNTAVLDGINKGQWSWVCTDFQQKSSYPLLRPPGQTYAMPSHLFTHRDGYLLRIWDFYAAAPPAIEYYHLQQRRVEKTVTFLRFLPFSQLSYDPKNKKLWANTSSGAAFSIGLNGDFKIHQTENAIKQAISPKAQVRAHLISTNKKTDKQAFLTENKVTITSLRDETTLGTTILGPDFPLDLTLDTSGNLVHLLHAQYFEKDGSQVDPSDVLAQISGWDRHKNKLLKTSASFPISCVNTNNLQHKLVLSADARNTYLLSADLRKIQGGKPDELHYYQKADIQTGKVTRSYTALHDAVLSYLTHNTQYILLKEESFQNKAAHLVVLDFDLNVVSRFSIPYAKRLFARLDDSSTRLIVLAANTTHDLLTNDTLQLFNFPKGQVIQTWRDLSAFFDLSEQLKDFIFTENHCLLPDGIYDIAQQKMILEWAIADEQHYFIRTADNFYYATPGMAETLRFINGQSSFPFRQYDLLLNRPDKVMAALPNPNPALVENYRKASLKRLRQMGFREQDISETAELPILKLRSENLPYETTQSAIELSVQASDRQFSLDRINIWVNDVPLYGREGISLRQQKRKEWQQKLEIPLSTGANHIQLSCLNEKGVESLLEEISINCTAPVGQPDLYLLVLGASHFRDSLMNLHYAARDAVDVAALLGNDPKNYAQVHLKQLTDQQFTKSQVLALKDWLKQTKVNDRVIVFVASHGLIDANLEYYLATYDTDFRHPADKGLSMDALESLIDGIPARQKLILLDACHSGEIDKESTTLTEVPKVEKGPVQFRSFALKPVAEQSGTQSAFELMKTLFVDMRRTSGATTISSAGGSEFAAEGDNWGNGVFTWCLKKGLQNQEADLNKDGKIMVSELQTWLGKAVETETNGAQHPIYRSENIANDWAVW